MTAGAPTTGAAGAQVGGATAMVAGAPGSAGRKSASADTQFRGGEPEDLVLEIRDK